MSESEVHFQRIQSLISIHPRRSINSRPLSILSELSAVLAKLTCFEDEVDRDNHIEIVNSIDLMSHYRDQVMHNKEHVCMGPENSKDPFCKNPYCGIGLLIRNYGIYTRRLEGWRFHPFYTRMSPELREKTIRKFDELCKDIEMRVTHVKENRLLGYRPPPPVVDPSIASYASDDPDVEILVHPTAFEHFSAQLKSFEQNNIVSEIELTAIKEKNGGDIIAIGSMRHSTQLFSPTPEQSFNVISVLKDAGESLPFYMMPCSDIGFKYRNRIFVRGLRYWFAILIHELSEPPSIRNYEFYFEDQFDFPTMIWGRETGFKLHITSYLTLKELHEVVDRISSDNWSSDRNTACEHVTFYVNAKTKRCYAVDQHGNRIGYRGLLLQYDIPKNPSGR